MPLKQHIKTTACLCTFTRLLLRSWIKNNSSTSNSGYLMTNSLKYSSTLKQNLVNLFIY